VEKAEEYARLAEQCLVSAEKAPLIADVRDTILIGQVYALLAIAAATKEASR